MGVMYKLITYSYFSYNIFAGFISIHKKPHKHLHVTLSVLNLFHLKSYSLKKNSSISSLSNAMLGDGCWECNPFWRKAIER